jgi:hypothetical protein
MRIITSVLAAVAVIGILVLAVLDTSTVNRILLGLGCIGVGLIAYALDTRHRRG